MPERYSLTEAEIGEIENAVLLAEQKTAGEIKVHLEQYCKTDPIFRAKALFATLGLSSTRDRNGVLLYVAVLDHKFAIIGDKGIHEKVGQDFWNHTAQIMKIHFANGRIAEGISAGVKSVGDELSTYFPIKPDDTNELDNAVSLG